MRRLIVATVVLLAGCGGGPTGDSSNTDRPMRPARTGPSLAPHPRVWVQRTRWPRRRGERFAGRTWSDCGLTVHARTHRGFDDVGISGQANCSNATAVFIRLIGQVQRESRDRRFDCSTAYCSNAKTGTPLVVHVLSYRCHVADFHDPFAAQRLVICANDTRYVAADAHNDGEHPSSAKPYRSGMDALTPRDT